MGSENPHGVSWEASPLNIQEDIPENIPEAIPDLIPLELPSDGPGGLPRDFLRDFLKDWLESGAILGFPGNEPGSRPGLTRGKEDPRVADDNRFLLGVGQSSCRKGPSSLQPSFYSSDFFLRDDRPWLVYPRYYWATRKTLLQILADDAPPTHGPRVEWKGPDREFFGRSFSDLQRLFRQELLSKAVPVAFEQATLRPSPSHIAHWIGRALEYSRDLPVHVYGAWRDSEGILGVTPEILFDLPGTGRVSTVALAGTRRDVDRGMLGALLEDSKELREHQWVIDGISEALGGHGLVLQYPTEEIRLPGLSHLRTRIDLSPERELDFSALVALLHPTPALGAYPRAVGAEWLLKADQEGPIRRGAFGAPFGATRGAGRGARCVVGIRNLLWRHEQLLCGAGCGVIAESRIEREWLEIQAKIRAVKGLFGLL